MIIVLLFYMSYLPIVTAAEAYSVGIGVLARIHFNTQTSDFDRTRAFYRQLGYTQGISTFPKTNTHLMAAHWECMTYVPMNWKVSK